jgi:DNA-binding beta-propeller fold protein YncE
MTDDLMRAMTRLAERGTPAGVDEMVDRIEAELAPHPDTPAWPSWVLPRASSRRRIGAVLTLTIALAIVLVVALVWLPHDAGGHGERVSSSTLTPEHLRLGQHAVLAAPGEGPTLLARTAGSLWAAGGVANRGATTLFELDPASGAVRARVKVPGRVVSIAPGFGSLWLAVVDPDGATGRGEIVRVDPTTRRTVATIELGAPTQLATGAGAVWVTDAGAGLLQKIDPGGNAVVASTPIGGASAVVVAGDKVWVTSPVDRLLEVVDAASVAPLGVRGQVDAVASLVVSGDSVWLVPRAGSEVTRYDSGDATSLGAERLGGRPLAVAAGPGGGLWVAVERGGATVVGEARPGQKFVSSPKLRGLGATAIVTLRKGLWILDPASSTLSLLEAR